VCGFLVELIISLQSFVKEHQGRRKRKEERNPISTGGLTKRGLRWCINAIAVRELPDPMRPSASVGSARKCFIVAVNVRSKIGQSIRNVVLRKRNQTRCRQCK